jgi:hypothetical protein
LFVTGFAVQFWIVMFSLSHYSQNFKLCLPFFFTPDVRPFPQLGCWQRQDHQAFSLATSRTALSSSREITILFTAAYYNLMDYMMVVQLFSSLRKRIVFMLGPKGQEIPPGTIFLETNKPIFVIQK